MDEAFNWAQLGTVAGVATAVTLLTQTLKRFVPRVDPKWIALGLSLIISLTHMIAFLDIRIETAVLTLLNAVVAAGAAIGEYEAFICPISAQIACRKGVKRDE